MFYQEYDVSGVGSVQDCDTTWQIKSYQAIFILGVFLSPAVFCVCLCVWKE